MSYIRKKDFNEVYKIQTKILTDYKDDIAKYAISDMKVKTRVVFDSIPFQLGKDNKNFQYKYEVVEVQWLIDAGLVYKCNCLSNLEIPLPSYVRKASVNILKQWE